MIILSWKDTLEEEDEFEVSYKLSIKDYIDKYFAFKKKIISTKLLYSERYLKIIAKTRINKSKYFKEPGINVLYRGLNINFKIKGKRVVFPKEAVRVCEMYKECYRLGIPKKYATGLLMMYLELCEGYNFA